jgi:hypothetical protein
LLYKYLTYRTSLPDGNVKSTSNFVFFVIFFRKPRNPRPQKALATKKNKKQKPEAAAPGWGTVWIADAQGYRIVSLPLHAFVTEAQSGSAGMGHRVVYVWHRVVASCRFRSTLLLQKPGTEVTGWGTVWIADARGYRIMSLPPSLYELRRTGPLHAFVIRLWAHKKARGKRSPVRC